MTTTTRVSLRKRQRITRTHSKLLPITAFLMLVTLFALNASFVMNDHQADLRDSDGRTKEGVDNNRANYARLLRLKRQPHTLRNGTSNISTLRRNFEKSCSNMQIAKNLDVVEEELERQLESFFTPPSTLPKLDGKDPVQPCMYTFIDLGANIGDSLGKFVDAGFPADCRGLERIRSRARYEIGLGVVTLGDGNVTELSDYVRELLEEHSRYPEDYCYVGIEGNPVFTPTLKDLEARAKGTIPLPVRAAHFYTDTVAAGKDGPTVLYLDTVNEDHNFWGSSIVRTHIDVEKSAENNGDTPVKAHVMGLTLSTLLKRSLKRQRGAHVIMKIDIEGAEYPVMNEAMDTLCDLKSVGVQVDLILETHSFSVLGEHSQEFEIFQTDTERRMKTCGIRSGMLSPKWGQ